MHIRELIQMTPAEQARIVNSLDFYRVLCAENALYCTTSTEFHTSYLANLLANRRNRLESKDPQVLLDMHKAANRTINSGTF